MRLTSLVLTSLIFLFSFGAFAQDGEKLFKQNCAACHFPTDKAMVGPGLKGITERAPSEEWIVKWVKGPAALIASGDAYANSIKDFSPAMMSDFGFLSDAEILSIVGYIKDYKEAAPVVVQDVAATADAAPASGQLDENVLRNILMAVAALLVVLVMILTSVRKSLTRLADAKTGETTIERGTWGSITHWMNTHRGWVGVAFLVMTLAFLRWGTIYLMDNIGVYQGYKPEQPIGFSHKIHAGQNGINCVYCHTSAEKGKTAGIPSLNVCMNCHTYVSQGPSGTVEIAKIYAAMDFNPATMSYGNNPKPVKWVRVHNLPDLAYFNHSQHVVVGKIQCQECHGAVQEMDAAEQFAPLTMGWCVDCHRKTSVQVADNAYYEDLHERTPAWHDGNPITVQRIGGLECAKCHY